MTHGVVWRLATPLRSFLARHKRASVIAQSVLERFPVLNDLVRGFAVGDPTKRYLAWIAEYDTIVDSDLAILRAQLAGADELPLLSLVVPVHEVGDGMIEELLQSLRAQVYERWQAFFVTDARSSEEVRRVLGQPSDRERRFTQLVASSSSFAHVLNDALRSAPADFVVLVEPGVHLRPHALYVMARLIEQHSSAILVYADDDVIDDSGVRSRHRFKPDWSEALLHAQNYLGGLVAFRRSRALDVGGCLEEADGDTMWGLFLRMTAGASPGTIHHLPFVLSHRRSAGPERQHVRDRDNIARAQEERLRLIGHRARVEPVGESSFRATFLPPSDPPTVTVIILSSGRLDLLRPCVEGVLSRTQFPRLEVILAIGESATRAPEREAYFKEITDDPRVRLLLLEDRPFNFSWVNNLAVGEARGELVCFLNDDTDVIRDDWLSEMVSHATHARVAAVGAMLYFTNGRIQHAGVVLGAGGLAGHSLKDLRRGTLGYHDRAVVAQDISCVTAACMLARRDVFLSVGGFDETLAVAFNDVDLCLRLRRAGWRIVWTPSAELFHRESSSLGRHDLGERRDRWVADWDLIHRRWGPELSLDPYYSPNLSLDQYQLWEPAFPPRVIYPWRAAGSTGA